MKNINDTTSNILNHTKMRMWFRDNGIVIYFKNQDGVSELRSYDEDGRLISYRNNKGFHERHKYDERGNEVYCKNSYGTEYYYEYDEYNRLSHIKTLGIDRDEYYTYYVDDHDVDYDIEKKIVNSNGSVEIIRFDQYGRRIQ